MIRMSTRNAIDRAHRALQHLSEKLDQEPESDFQGAVDELDQRLSEAEADHHATVRKAAA